MADLSVELASLNANARELLDKHDKAFSKLENLSEAKKGEIATLGNNKVQELKDTFTDGYVDTAGNSLKLGGKSLEEIATKRIVTLWEGSSTGGNLALSDNVDAFDFLMIDFDLSTETSGNNDSSWHQSIFMTKTQILSRETYNEPVDGDHFTVINSTTFNYRRTQSNNALKKIVGVKL